jgi:competence ComEA-like helix-hairpin-helix protein
MRAARSIGVLAVTLWCAGSAVLTAANDRAMTSVTIDEGKRERIRAHVRTHKVNINQASKDDLMTLDGVSAGVAQNIIAYREAHGPFKRAHDLAKVDGIGKDVLDKNVGRIAVK